MISEQCSGELSHSSSSFRLVSLYQVYASEVEDPILADYSEIATLGHIQEPTVSIRD